MESLTKTTLRTNTGEKVMDEKVGKEVNVRATANLTLDWEGVDEEMLQRLAQGFIKIQISHAFAAKKEIPQGDMTLKVLEFCPNQPRKPRTPATIDSFSADELKAQLRKMGFDL